MRGIRLIALAGLAFVPASIALASDQPGTTADQWKEELSGVTAVEHTTDAGKFPSEANLTRGGGPLNRITGQLVRLRDVDMYCIAITDPTAFSATTSGTNDTNLALFNLDGTGIAFNDNDPTGGNDSRLTNLFTASLPPGLYFLAINRNDAFGPGVFNYPLSGTSPMFHTLPPTVRNVEYGPNNPLAPLTSWNYNSTGFEPFNYTYTITLTGAGYHQLPAPGAALLLGLGGLCAARRRR